MVMFPFFFFFTSLGFLVPSLVWVTVWVLHVLPVSVDWPGRLVPCQSMTVVILFLFCFFILHFNLSLHLCDTDTEGYRPCIHYLLAYIEINLFQRVFLTRLHSIFLASLNMPLYAIGEMFNQLSIRRPNPAFTYSELCTWVSLEVKPRPLLSGSQTASQTLTVTKE